MHVNQTLVSISANGRSHPTAHTAIETAILHTVAYADLFDYPVTAVEIHRYLEGTTASLEEVESVLANGRFVPRQLSYRQGYYMLPGRENIVSIRQQRAAVARQLWPEAVRYGRFIAHLPFVHMVAVTGSLAVGNPTHDADIDYLIVTENGRLWLCRAFVIALVRLAARRGVILCPNYFLSQNALAFTYQNLYTAHEVVQMIPLFGLDIYRRIRQLNAWTNEFLPNAVEAPRRLTTAQKPRRWPRALAELPLRTPAGQWLEQWEMRRKIRKFRMQSANLSETDFCADWCKGHFDAHNGRTMTTYQLAIDDLRLTIDD